MKVDLRDKLIKNNKMKVLAKDHRKIFEQRLNQSLHQKTKTNHSFLKMAASIVLIFSLGYFALLIDKPSRNNNTDNKVTAKDITPEFKKVEGIYLTAINYQIARITITDENRDLLEVFLSQLSDLQKEYSDLSKGLNNKKEISESTIDALIENLQLQLHLMRQLKKKLDKIENIKLEENESNQV